MPFRGGCDDLSFHFHRSGCIVSEQPRDRTWFWIAVSGGLAWIVYLIFFNPRPGLDNLSPPSLKGASTLPADLNWQVSDLSGKPFNLSELKGKPIFLNVWATWCPPCVAEMPSIANLASNSRLKDVAFVCVSADSSNAVVERFLSGKNWENLQVYRATSAPPAGFETDGIPATFLISPDGKVLASEVGAAQWDHPDVVDFIEKMAKSGK